MACRPLHNVATVNILSSGCNTCALLGFHPNLGAGFGWSDKALVEYSSANLWSDQIADFVREVVWSDPNSTGSNSAASSSGVEEGRASTVPNAGSSTGPRVALAGNSLGGYAALCTAAKYPELVRCVWERGHLHLLGV